MTETANTVNSSQQIIPTLLKPFSYNEFLQQSLPSFSFVLFPHSIVMLSILYKLDVI